MKDIELIKKVIHLCTHSEASLEKLLQDCLELVCNVEWLAGGGAGAVFLADGEHVRLAAHYRLDRDLRTRCQRVAYGECLCGRVAQTGQSLFCGSMDGRHEIRHRIMADHGHYVLPLGDRVRVLGVLNVYTEAGHQCRTEEWNVLRSVAGTLALMIAERGFEGSARSTAVGGDVGGVRRGGGANDSEWSLELLQAVSRAVVVAPSEPGLLEELTRALVDSGRYVAAWVALVVGSPSLQEPSQSTDDGVEDGRRLVATAYRGATRSLDLRDMAQSAMLCDYPMWEVIGTDQSEVLAHRTEGKNLSDSTAGWNQFGVRASCILPLKHDGTVLGALVVHAGSPDDVSQERLVTLRMVGDLAACGIKQHRVGAERDLLSTANERTPDSVFVTNSQGRIIYVNRAFEQQTGYNRDEVLGRTPEFLKSGRMSVDFYKRLWSTILKGDLFHDNFVNRRKDGCLLYEEKYLTPIKKPGGEITHFISTGRDITERKRLENQLRQFAYHDSLTGLPNRRLLNEHLTQMIKHAARHTCQAAVIIADLNKFKCVNDRFGHAVGDQLLVAVADRLRGVVREGDVVARIGGDEFALVLDDTDRIGASRVAERLLDKLGKPVQLDGVEIYVGAALGIAQFPQDGDTPDRLLRNADVAMYRVKGKSELTYSYYNLDI